MGRDSDEVEYGWVILWSKSRFEAGWQRRDGMAEKELATFSVVPGKKPRVDKNLPNRFFYKYVQTSIETS